VRTGRHLIIRHLDRRRHRLAHFQLFPAQFGASAVIDDHLLVGDPDRQCRHHAAVLPLGIRKLT
jgi:hypothetical protein